MEYCADEEKRIRMRRPIGATSSLEHAQRLSRWEDDPSLTTARESDTVPAMYDPPYFCLVCQADHSDIRDCLARNDTTPCKICGSAMRVHLIPCEILERNKVPMAELPVAKINELRKMKHEHRVLSDVLDQIYGLASQPVEISTSSATMARLKEIGRMASLAQDRITYLREFDMEEEL